MSPRFLLLFAGLLLALPAALLRAQSGELNLPADLYVLLNDGVVQRMGFETGVESVTPEEAFVIDFGIDALGEQIAYRTQEGLVVSPLDSPGDARVVDRMAGVPPLRGRGQTVAWSPTGDAIAYTTQAGARIYFTRLGVPVSIAQPGLLHLYWSPDGRYLAAQAEHDIWWLYKLDGSSPVLHAALPSSRGVAWAEDAVLAFVPAGGGLYTMNLDDANTQTEILDPDAEYHLPALSPDGDLLFFRRDPDEVVPEGYGQLVALAPGGQNLEVRGVTPIDLGGNLRWAPGAGLMLAFEGGVLALFDPGTGQGVPLPVTDAVAYAWGPYPPVGPVQETGQDAAPELTEAPLQGG